MNDINNIKIGGINYNIEFCSNPDQNDYNIDGQIKYNAQTIKIRSDGGKDYKKVVLLHEILHGIFEQKYIEHDEELIEKLSYGLYEVFVNNDLKVLDKFIEI
ncbi:MAG: hypothetical protein PHY47_12870 [Lachnospiraceae bacterium]|nr:hypothetical protein [Lachnospiraceae bacterium]